MSRFEDAALLAGRVVLGGYLAGHGAQKLFGSFDGPGIDAVAGGFDHLGLRPGKVMARVAAISELGGGLLTAAGAAQPLGPVAIAATMAVASSTHRANGPFAAKGGYELALTNLGAALSLAVVGTGRYSIDRVANTALPKSLARLTIVGSLFAGAAMVAMVVKAKPPEPTAPEPIASDTVSPEESAD